jgi:hypothetical protein
MLKFLHKAFLIILFAAFASQASAMFIQPDTYDVTVPGVGTNRYAYSSDDPVNLSDPGGHVPDNWATKDKPVAYDSHGFRSEYQGSGKLDSVTYKSWNDSGTADYKSYQSDPLDWRKEGGTIGALSYSHVIDSGGRGGTYGHTSYGPLLKISYSEYLDPPVQSPFIEMDVALMFAGAWEFKGLYSGAAQMGSDWPLLAGALRETAESSRAALANKGSYNFSVGEFTSEQTQAMGEAWVGSGYTTTSRGFLESANGLRQYRPPSAKNSPFATTGIQANLSQRLPGMTEWLANGHINVLP